MYENSKICVTLSVSDINFLAHLLKANGIYLFFNVMALWRASDLYSPP